MAQEIVEEGGALLSSLLASQNEPQFAGQKAIRKTLKGTAVLSKLLPTGSVLAFQVLSPVLTHQGQCHTITSQYLTLIFLVACGLSCFLLCFTDSIRDPSGKIRHGIATTSGLLVFDGPVTLTPQEADKYRIKFRDFFHGFMSALVFAAVALFDGNVVKCLYPAPSEDLQELLLALPIGIGIISCLLFITFPTKRNGIGNPLSKK